MKIIVAALLLAAFAFAPLATCEADLSLASELDLATVRCHSGISVHLSTKQTISSVRYGNTENGSYLELQTVEMSDENGDTYETNGFMSIDAATGNGRTFLAITEPDNLSSGDGMDIGTGNIVLNGEDAGALYMEGFRTSESQLLIASHDDGSTGIDMAYQGAATIDSFTYQMGNDELAVQGIYLSQTPGGTAENPQPGQGEMSFGGGTWSSDDWVSLDIGTNNSGDAELFVEMPVQGTIRIEEISLAGQSYGPTVLDNMQGTVSVRTPVGATWQY